MIDLIIGPVAEWLVKQGAEHIKESAQFRHSRLAIREAIYREVRFNRALLDEVEIANTQNPNQASFLRSIADEMNFSAFSHLENSYIPIRLFFDGPRPTIEEASDSQFHKWSNLLKNEAEWIERIYLRARILRARWRSRNEAAHNPSSLYYVQWLMTQWIKQYQSKDEIT